MVQNPPEGYQTVTPYLIVEDARDFLAFAQAAFDAKPRGELMEDPRNGLVGHAELQVGSSVLMVADTMEGFPETKTLMHVYADDVDAAFAKAVAAGCTVEQELTDQFYGDRTASVLDKWGNKWYMATHKEDVPPEELMERMKAAMAEESS